MTASTVRVGVLSFHDSKESKAICNAIEELGHEPVWLRERPRPGRPGRLQIAVASRYDEGIDERLAK